MKKADLITIAGDLNKILGLDPPIETDKNAKQDALEEKISEAVKLLEPGDKLEDDTVRHLKAFLNPENYEGEMHPTLKRPVLDVLMEMGLIEVKTEEEEPEETEPEEAEEVTLEDEIEACVNLKQLKDIARAEDEFKDIRSGLTKYKVREDVDKLKTVMLDMLEMTAEEEAEAEEPKKEAAKKEAPPSKKTAPKDDSKGKTPSGNVDTSTVVKGMKTGCKVEFTTAPNSKKAPNQKLTGTVVSIYMSKRMGKEAVKIETSKGIFFKTSKAITLK